MCSFSNCDDCEEYCDYDDFEVDLSDFEFCIIANSYMDKEYCKNTGCEKCRFYLDS